MNQIIIGTAGHIDHGKTALVKALTGCDTDQLAEEQERGMTIDLGFAFLDKRTTIIDVPGHERFIRNMVAGVSTIDFVILVVALDDGIMPQTTEHLHIVDLLNIPDGLIVLTKADLVKDKQWEDLVIDDIKDKTKGTVLDGKPIIKTSTVSMEGIQNLRDSLLSLNINRKSNYINKKFRLQIDRVFNKTGYGMIITGTVISGELFPGEAVSVQPSNAMGKVRGLQSHGISVEKITSGDRAAVNLIGVEKKNIWRGAELVTPKSIYPSKTVIVSISLMQHTKWKLKNQQRIRIHLGTSDTLAKIIYIPKTIVKGNSSNAIIEFEKKISIAIDDKFIVRSYSPMETIGGGKILDKDPKGNWKRLKMDCQILSKSLKDRFLQLISQTENAPNSVSFWAEKLSKSDKEIFELIKINNLKNKNGMIFSNEMLKNIKNMIINYLTTFHKSHLYRQSVNSESVRIELGLNRNWFDYILTNFDREEIIIKEGKLALSSHEVKLNDFDEKLLNKINIQFSQNKFTLFSVKEISKQINCDYEQTLEFLHILKRQGASINITGELWLSKSDLDYLIEDIKLHFISNEILTISDFKSITHLSRKTAIPLLEYLDKKNITYRKGNDRIQGTSFSKIVEIV